MSTRNKKIGIVILVVGIVGCVCLVVVGAVVIFLIPTTSSTILGGRFRDAADIEVADVPFTFVELDNTAGDIKLVGDIDGDGQPDVVIGGMPDEPLTWYQYPEWQKHQIAVPVNEFTTDGALGDVDGDGDLDIVVPDGNTGENVLWFENPRPDNDPLADSDWPRHVIGGIGNWGKDIELADYDGDGRLDVATRIDLAAMIFFQTGPDQWQESRFGEVELGNEGMASGDIDGDGDVDIVLRGVWLQNPGGEAAKSEANWQQYRIGDAHTDFKALVVDLNQDGVMDVLFSSSEGTADVNWWQPMTGGPTGEWAKQTLISNLERAHTLQAADMDLDGDLDVVVGQMHTSAEQQIMILFNNGNSDSWSQQIVDAGGLHNGVVADIGSDCDYDIYGANWAGNPPLRLWLNGLDSSGPLDRWTYKRISDSHQQTFGLAFGDVDSDSRVDVVSGRFWYQNPGYDLMGSWAQHEFPEGMEAILTADVDGDANADVIAQKNESELALYWLEADGEGWTQVRIGSVEAASHELGAQGYRAAQIEGDDRPEIAISSGNGIYYFRIPADPEAGNWPRVHVNGNPSDEGFGVSDINGDGWPDVAATTGDAKGVEWYQNPGDGSEEWTAIPVGDFSEALYPDRTEIADLNGDGRPDIIVTEENGTEAEAETYWWEQPQEATSAGWPRHLITTQGTTNSMDRADMDGDGDVDIVLAEHRGQLRIAIWANNGDGTFVEMPVWAGHESHLGGRLVDLDGDGDLDIVSIAWDANNEVHLWRNDRVHVNCIP